jgi:hypothetical protein
MITIKKVEVIREDYLVTLVMPDGTLFTVMIPLDYASLPSPTFPFGLNFYSTDHYRKA